MELLADLGALDTRIGTLHARGGDFACPTKLGWWVGYRVGLCETRTRRVMLCAAVRTYLDDEMVRSG